MERYSKKILELRKEGKTYKEITKILGCAMSTVSYHCKMNGLGDNNQKTTKEDIELYQKLYDELGSLKKVSKITKRSFDTLKKYIKTKDRIKTMTSSESVILWRKRVKIRLVEYKGGKCQICGYNKCFTALEFHHLNPNSKDFTISGKSLSFEKLKYEVDKCILVCSNCHSEIHAGLINV
jgi:5-methylcytosine-specific restriction endonuclease McrA